MSIRRLRCFLALAVFGLVGCRGQAVSAPTSGPTAEIDRPGLVYLWPADAPADLYLLNPQGGQVQRLSENADVLEFSISPDGTAIYFSAGNAQGGSDLFLLPLDGALRARLLVACQQAACRSPQLSPDGRWLAHEYLAETPDGILQPVQVLLNGEGEQVLRVGDPAHENLMPSWSADGRLAFYDRDEQAFFIYDPETGASTRLPNQTGQPGSWAPDGSAFLAAEIFYVPFGPVQEVSSSRLLRYDPANGASLDLTRAENVEDASPVYSPDGQLIAFARRSLDPALWTQGRQLWLMNADGSEPRPLTDAPLYNHFDFAWSPDGRWLAYVRFNQTVLNQPPELWMIQSDGKDPIQLVIGGYAPQWLP